MWPVDPDEFQPMIQPPPDHDRGEAWFFLCMDGRIACIAEQGIPRPLAGDELRWLDLELGDEHFLGVFEGRACFAVEGSGRLPEGYAADNLYSWLGRVAPPVFYLAGRAQQVVDWHNTHRFCGRCGARTESHDAERAKVCPDCGLINYPRISPSIIVLVTRGDEMLLARNARWLGDSPPVAGDRLLARVVEAGKHSAKTMADTISATITAVAPPIAPPMTRSIAPSRFTSPSASASAASGNGARLG